MFGDFRISRNITTAEGCKVCCKYMVHYDLLAKEIQFVGRRQGARCIKQNTDACPRSKRINRMVKNNEFWNEMKTDIYFSKKLLKNSSSTVSRSPITSTLDTP